MINLVLKNIKEKSARALLAGLSIIIATASLTFFFGLENGIRNATFEELEKKSPLTQITVRPSIEDTGIISFLNKSDKGKITSDKINEIEKISGVKEVYPEIQFNNFASLEASIFGFGFETDAMLFGVPYNFINADIQTSTNWSKSDPYPTIIPKKLLDLYNIALAAPQGLPLLSEDGLIGKEIILYPNYSTFFPGMNVRNEEIRLEVVGFSDKANLLGVTLPYEFIEELNQTYSDNKESQIVELYVEVEDASMTQKISEEIEDLGFSTLYLQKNLQDVEAKLSYLSTSLGFISFIVLLATGLAIISSFLSTIAERKKEIGLLRAIGATKSHIKRLIIGEALIIGLIASIVGSFTGLLISKMINRYAIQTLEQITFSTETLFYITPTVLIKSIIFGTILTLISVYLPAHKAANLSPIEALKK
ncbi:ABC transporter permease [Candidatus Peregrinibacteria bacterium]|nr:ABC transporter permease [Candidatus Peregrinibacteria bacterium]